MHPRRGIIATLILLLAACGGSDASSGTETAATGTESTDLAVQVASYDVATGEDQRLIVGVFTPGRGVVGGGEVTFRLGFVGDEPSGQATLGDPVTATFVPVPGKGPDELTDAPAVIEGPGVGVYQAVVDLDQPGFWGVQVVAEMADGTTRTGSTTFPVLAEHEVPAVGEPAPPSENLTVGGAGPEAAIDSRAATEGQIPDPELHRTTIADAIDRGLPVVAVFSTPVYCASQFCGPITDTVQELAAQFGDRAAFIHVEVWKDFEAQELNEAAAEWIQSSQGGNEPWVFLVDGQGRVAARWDNVLDEAELRSLLEELPAS